jgi:hypothetical protein
VAHAYNPSYSGGRNQEDHSLKPETLSRKKHFTKKGLVEWVKVQALSSNPSTAKTKQQQKDILAKNK